MFLRYEVCISGLTQPRLRNPVRCGFLPRRNAEVRKLDLVDIFWRHVAAAGSEVLKVVSAQVHAKQLPQDELRRVAVVVRNHAVAQHKQGRKA